MKNAAAFCLALALAAGSVTASAAQYPPVPRTGQGDQLVIAGLESLYEASLPRGPVEVVAPLSEVLAALTYTADGRLLGVRQLPPPQEGPVFHELVEVGEDGGLLPIGSFDLEAQEPIDLAATPDGRLFMLTFWFWWNPPDVVIRLVELDPATGAILSRRILPGELAALAPAPDGLWTVGQPQGRQPPALFHLDPDTGNLRDTGFKVFPDLGYVLRAADADSTGALWILAETPLPSPPVSTLWRLDPATGSRRMATFESPQDARALTIRRQCRQLSTARCLQGGRFLAEVTWQDFEGHTGPGRATPSRSADSTLFWFFDPANWELMVKVLDGCAHNDHFWVFSAATTNVAYSLRVTDLETDASWLFENRLGQSAPATTDILAFPCTGSP